MSTTEPFPSNPIPPAPPAPKPRRVRRVLFASALLLTGGVIGAVIAGPVRSQGWGPGWHDGPRWHHRGGPAEFGPGEDFGGRMFFPGRVERGVERLGWAVDASTEQKSKINAIAQKAADDIYELRAKHLEARKQVIATLAAPTIDRPKLEALRADQMKLADTATKRITDAVADVADILTPAQRADLNKRFERWQRWFRG